jgi:DNA-binding transcriptional regulator YiaG
MNDLSLQERLAQLEQAPAIAPANSGSHVSLLLTIKPHGEIINSIAAAGELKRLGMTMAAAKRAMDTLLGTHRAYVDVPRVENAETLIALLAECNITARRIGPPETVDVKAIRTALGLTQEQFALRFGLEIDAVQNWESGRRKPDAAARSYLRVIAARPAEVEAALVQG